jgi:gliding motility-associated-like protein
MRNLYDEGATGFLKDRKGLGKQLRNCLILLTTLTAMHGANAQLVTTQNANAQDLAQALAGPGVTVSNFSRSGHINSSGTFTNTGTNLGISSGVMLSTGSVLTVSQAANAFSSSSYSGNGDVELQTLTNGYVQDKSVLEFDVVPQGNVLMFNYVFASEEYPEWVCTQFNDVFGFFISGPNPAGGNYSAMNIAKVPGTNLPVAINTINRGLSGAYGNPVNCQSLSYSSLHRNNLTPTVNTGIVFDGMTVVLTAVASVVPCQTYHLKLAVGDISDRIYDSGVFIEANSVISIPVDITASTQLAPSGYNSAYEGCVSGKFTFSLPTPQPSDIQFSINVGGTATNGVDYPTIPSVITIPAGTVSKDLVIVPTQDGTTEADETIEVSIINPCTGQPLSSAMMVIKDDVQATITATPSVVCAGQTAQLEAIGGTSFTWAAANGLTTTNIYNPIVSPTSTTTYNVSMSWGSCSKTASKTITVGGTHVTLAASPSLKTCDGSPVQLTADAGNGATYAWNGGAGAAVFSATNSGAYTVTATDVTGCTTTASANVVVSNLSLGSPVISPSCGGAANGGVNITVNGTATPYTFNWNNAATSEDLTNIAAGTYTVSVSNTDGCSVTQSYTVTQSSTGISLAATVTDVTCNGGNNGSINLSVNGGNAPYNFVWNNGAQTQNISNLNAGNYDVVVTDAIGCMGSQSIAVSEMNGIAITATKTDVSCNGGNNGAVNVAVTGGNSVYTFNWNDNNNNQNRAALAAGSYTLTVTDGNGCSAVSTTTIAEPAAMQVTTTATGTNCTTASGAISTSVANGASPFTYNWSHNANAHTANVTGLAPAIITVTVTDANGCSAAKTTTVGVASNTANANFTQSGNYCTGNVNFVSAAPGSGSHIWNFGGNSTSTQYHPTFAFAGAGSYNVTHIVTKGFCADTVIKPVVVFPIPSVSATVSNITCNNTNDGAIQVNVANGTAPYSYNWGSGIHTANRSNLTAGNYTVTVVDQNSCSAAYTATVAQANGLNVTEAHNNVTCYGSANGSIDLTVSGGVAPYTYVWNNGASSKNITSLNGGTFSVSVSDANNCSATKTVIVAEPAAIVISSTHTDVVCNGQNNGSIQTMVSGGTGSYTYEWSNGIANANVNSVPAGYYAVTVTDGNNCSAVTNVTIDEPVALTVNPIKENPLCNGKNEGSINLDVFGGTQPYNFVWNTGANSKILNNLAAGTYDVVITDANGCGTQASISLVEPAAITIQEAHSTIGCASNTKGSISLTVNGGLGGYNFQWNNGSTTSTASNLAAGSYSVTVVDGNGCEAALNNIVIAENPPLNLNAAVTDAACTGINNGKINLTVNGGDAPYLFNWDNGNTAPVLSNLAAGTYKVSVTDSKGCSGDMTAEVKTKDGIQLSADVTQPTCTATKGAINLSVSSGTAPYSFEWNTGVKTEDLANVAEGAYSVIVRDANQCEVTSAFNIANPLAFTVDVTGPASINMGETADLHVATTSSEQLTYTWLPMTGEQCATCTDVKVTPAQTTEYTVVATNNSGCSATGKVTVTVNEEASVWMPNAFSPNGDGNNDDLQLYGNLNAIHYFQLLVFNRWGEKVFETNDQHFNWDGNYKGERQTAGSYIYVMKVVYANGKSDRTFKGSITLL